MDPKERLLAKLTQIFSDGVVDEDEMASFRAFLAAGELSANELREAFEVFVATTWKGTIEDGRVTDTERKRLREIVRVLGLDAAALPPQWRVLLGG